jgi:hypothetical protein
MTNEECFDPHRDLIQGEEQLQFLECIPEAVRQIARAIPLLADRQRRPVCLMLLTDPEMDLVWRRLRKVLDELGETNLKAVLASLARHETLDSYELSVADMSLQTRILAGFYVRLSTKLCTIPNALVSVPMVRKELRKSFSASGQEAEDNLRKWGGLPEGWDNRRGRPLAADFLKAGSSIREGGNPYALRRTTGGEDGPSWDRLRVAVRLIGETIHQLFGSRESSKERQPSFMYGTIRTIAAVIYGEELDISAIRKMLD